MDLDTEKAFRLTELSRLELLEQKSLDYVRYLSCLTFDGLRASACQRFLSRWPKGLGAAAINQEVDLAYKAAVPPGTAGGATWGSQLVGVAALADGFIQFSRNSSLLGKISGLKRVPFGVKCPYETGPANYWWVGEGKPKPLSPMAFNNLTLDLLKAVTLVPFSKEFLYLAVPGTDASLRDELKDGLVAFQDKSFLDPASSAVAGSRPPSVTSGTVAIPSTGNLQVDVQSLINAFFTGRPGAENPVLIAGGAKAAQLKAMTPGFGFEVVSSAAAGGTVVMLDPAGILVADGGVQIDLSDATSLQMSDTPDDPSTATTVNVSMFQMNSVAYRVERFLNFTAMTGAVRYLAA